jgi:CubicO group peptidase (beta-lactamase class C family)
MRCVTPQQRQLATAASSSLRWLALLLLLTAAMTEASEGDPRPSREAPVAPDFTATIERLRSEWAIPGVAVAVIHGDATRFVGTWGVRERGGSAPITPDTLFGIASITKVLVTGGLAVLVDEGKIDWDDAVREHLPAFELADPYVSANVTIYDLLVHRSGIAWHGDWLEEVPGLSEAAALERMAHLGQSMPFRYGTAYSSYSFIALAELIRQVTGKPWGEFLDKRVWEPLGMHHTYAHADDFIDPENVLPTGDGWSDTLKTGQAAVRPDVDVATPHVKWEPFIPRDLIIEQRELEFDVSHFHRTAIDPGQGAFASVRDLAKWARVLLNEGMSDGVRLLHPDTVRRMVALYGTTGSDWPFADNPDCRSGRSELEEVGVGLGLFVFAYCGHVLYGHSGGELGYESLMLIDPLQDFGLVVMVNNTRSEGSVLAIMSTLLDWQYGYPDRSWAAWYKKKAIADAREAFEIRSRAAASRPAVAIDEQSAGGYPGCYSNDFAGDLRVAWTGERLIATTGESYVLELTPLGGGEFRAIPQSPIRYWLTMTFARNPSGTVSGVTVSHPWFDAPLHFARVADPASSPPVESGPVVCRPG